LKNSRALARLPWILCLLSATTRRVKPVPSGRSADDGALGIEDPAAVQGTDIQKESAFDMAFYYLERRISLFRNLPLKSLDQLALGARLRGIGQTEGASRHRADVA